MTLVNRPITMMKSVGDRIDISDFSLRNRCSTCFYPNEKSNEKNLKMTDDRSIRSSSSTVFDESMSFPTRSSFFSCCQSSRRSRPNGFFHRMQIFKAQKRRSSVKKQQIDTTTTISNGYLTNDDENHCELTHFIPPPSPYQHYHRSSIGNSPSIPSLHHYSYRHRLNEHFDAYSFNDIEMSSSTTTTTNNSKLNENQQHFLRSTSKSCLSSGTTDLSAYSTQSLLKKLLDKAQLLDYYYNQIWTKTNHQSSISLNSSRSNSIVVGRPNSRSYSLIARPIESKRKISPTKRLRAFHGNHSSDSSRTDLYHDEDNVLRELIRFNNDIDLILSRLEMEGEGTTQPLSSSTNDDQQVSLPSTTMQEENVEQLRKSSTKSDEILTMKTNVNEINIHLLLANDIDRVRQIALDKLLKMIDTEHAENLTLTKLNKLPKSTTWKNKNVFGVPLRIYQQMTGEVLPKSICSAFQYVRLHAGKCDGLFRKPGVKSKIDRLRKQIEENSAEKIQFEDFQPFVVADVIRQYFRELPECLIPPILTRFLCQLIKHVTQDEQILAIRYIFLVLPDENREVLENLLRFLLDVSIRSGNSQTVCRSLARIFLPSVFQSFYELHSNSSKFLWWKRKKDKADAIEQENERLTLEHCLMLMIVNVDLLCRVPIELNDELQLSSVKKPKNLDELIRTACDGEFQMKKFMSKESEKFLQRLATMKFKNVPTHLDDIQLSMNKSLDNSSQPIWKCSIEIRQTNVKSVCQRLVHERYLWDDYFAESRVVEKIDDDKEIVQYVLNLLDSLPVRSFCEFRFLKKISPNSMLISSMSIDHLQNHFLPGTIGLTNQMFFYVTPSTNHPDSTCVTQLVSIDFSGRSTFWYEQVFGHILAHRLSRLRETFVRNPIVRV